MIDDNKILNVCRYGSKLRECKSH